jgi:hypothetical protein
VLGFSSQANAGVHVGVGIGVGPGYYGGPAITAILLSLSPYYYGYPGSISGPAIIPGTMATGMAATMAVITAMAATITAMADRPALRSRRLLPPLKSPDLTYPPFRAASSRRPKKENPVWIFSPNRILNFRPQKSEGKASPIIQLGLLGLTATLFAGLLVIATGARFAQRAFTIQFFLETSQCLIDGLAFF